MAAERLPRGGDQRTPVDAAVLEEAPVLDAHDSDRKRGRDVLERDPRATQSVKVEAVGFESDALAVEDPAVGGAPVGALFVERRCVRRVSE